MLLLLLSMLVGLTLAQNPNYNYQRPHVAFNVESQAKLPAKFVVQTLGPNSRTYDVESHRAPTVYENHQTQVVQVQQQQQYAYQQQLQAPPQQLHTTSYANPLLINAATYQQQTPTLVSPPAPAPPAQPISYYAQPQQLVSYQAPPAPPPPAPVYGVAVQQQQLPQRLYFKNPQPYAVVTLPNGQKTLDAGHGSGFAPNEVQYKLLASTGSQSTAPRVGDHVGQSQSSSLDAFKYKQAVPDDTREYQRFVNNCAANGQCQQFNLSPGQIDPSHQQLLQQARASTQPRIEGCTKSEAIYVPVGAQLNNQGQLRPKGRRQFERKEQQFDRHPYN
ncbi:uncharacterized protein Dwil_GK14249 [Drosophila willistoni]|uniref:DUF4794 domain-containing protein n=1 Tax=Drosophila willistoni TaxID=7260 RepID=B4NHT1_DROWI|nr:uncharacterized protein LOC6650492 [Drosophila willistoni]EDW84691.2 uncharacterized protein Dwil_GK14249 [Drosophila willistoni]